MIVGEILRLVVSLTGLVTLAVADKCLDAVIEILTYSSGGPMTQDTDPEELDDFMLEFDTVVEAVMAGAAMAIFNHGEDDKIIVHHVNCKSGVGFPCNCNPRSGSIKMLTAESA
jgi:hypothetical protein